MKLKLPLRATAAFILLLGSAAASEAFPQSSFWLQGDMSMVRSRRDTLPGVDTLDILGPSAARYVGAGYGPRSGHWKRTLDPATYRAFLASVDSLLFPYLQERLPVDRIANVLGLHPQVLIPCQDPVMHVARRPSDDVLTASRQCYSPQDTLQTLLNAFIADTAWQRDEGH